jgi:2-polyprenyl-6-methoxyphenol hydroxylase-like FAD-dependent oxidoreductase
MDVLWFRLPREAADPEGLSFIVGAGVGLVLIDRGDYFQVAYVIPKGGYEAVRAAGLDALVARVGQLAPSLAGRTTGTLQDGLKSWDDVHMLTVVIDRLRRWHAPGVLLIGDAAHAMSPMGGVGVNLAVQDAVAAARILAPHLAAAEAGGAIPGALFKSLESQMRRVQARRLYPTLATQILQRALGRGVITRVLESDQPLPVPAFIRLAQRLPALQGLTARAIAIGFLPEHIARA